MPRRAAHARRGPDGARRDRGGWRLFTDPTFDPPGRRYAFGWGTSSFDGVRQVADLVEVDIAVLHLGGVRFPVTGPVRYTMTGADAVELCGLLRPRVAVPVHHEGWSHFREGRGAVERRIARAPDDVGRLFRWLPPGVGVELVSAGP